MQSTPSDSPQQRFAQALALVRAERHAEALALLEPIVATGLFPLARQVLAFARFRAEGRDLAEFTLDGERFRFRIAEGNLGLDMFLVSGRFFEQAELEFLRGRVPSGGTVVDVGANIGNHAVYFGRFLRPSRLIPVEPNPQAVRRLTENLALNGIVPDARGLGKAVGATAGSLGLTLPKGADLVLERLQGTGDIPVLPLDDLIDGPVDFLKIDVEGMEMEVLAGARRILSEQRPLIFIEVEGSRTEAFRAWCGEAGYVIERSFPARDYANHFLRPA
ncbi:MAG TPA: FkbM family methyltransferase [Azospirillum sp.]|nr:FkbM family methyltransferase [Azospirillum sp.]